MKFSSFEILWKFWIKKKIEILRNFWYFEIYLKIWTKYFCFLIL